MKKILYVIFMAVCVFYIVSEGQVLLDKIGFVGSSERAAVEAAITEIKGQLYDSSGGIPEIETEVIYKNGKDYIVITRWKCNMWGTGFAVDGSYACYIRVPSSRYATYMGRTKQKDYNASYDLENLKAIFRIQ